MSAPTDWITEQPLSLDQLLLETADPACGALAIFGGTVRDLNDGAEVARLWYEAHPTMAPHVLAQLEVEARGRFGVPHVRVQHRIGLLELGDVSLWVVVRARHRDAAFDAARWALEAVKARAPIWKREHYTDGRHSWLEGTSLASPPPENADARYHTQD